MSGSDTAREDEELADYKEEFTEAREVWSLNYDEALDDFKFGRKHEHWPEAIRREREREGKPCLTIPLLPPILRQVENDARQNKPAIKTSAADSVADPETADVVNGLIRQIERASHADVAYDTAIAHAVTGGFGFFKVNTRYASDDSFEQDIVIEAVPNAFSIIPDPDSTAATSEDWNLAFEIETLSERAFKRRFKDADPVSFDDAASATGRHAGRSPITIVYRWGREESVRQIVALSPPRVDAPEEAIQEALQQDLIPESMIVDLVVYEKNKALFDALGVSIVGLPRDVPSYTVTQKCLSGAGVLKETPWAGKWIPIIPVYGSDINIEGERFLEGMVRAAKDEQRRHNYHISSATESTALAPKAPFIGKAGQFLTDAEKWATANTTNWPYIEYDDESGVGPPQRQGYAGVPIGDYQMAISASDSIKAITGIHNASLGASGNETSGKAIFARQREGDVGSFHYTDNLSRAIGRAGEIILDLIPKVYSVPRIVRVLGPDEQERQVAINQPTTTQRKAEGGQMEEVSRVFDLTAGKYDLVVKAGPSFSTQREEFVALVTEVIRSFPQAAPVLLDLVVKNYDLPDAEKVVERLEAMLPANLQGETPETQQAQAQMKEMAQIIGELKGQLAAAKADHRIEARKVEIDAYEAETGRLKAVIPKGAPYDPATMQAVIGQSLAQLFNSPDILEAAGQGAPPEQLAAMLAQRMQPPAQDQQQPQIAA